MNPVLFTGRVFKDREILACFARDGGRQSRNCFLIDQPSQQLSELDRLVIWNCSQLQFRHGGRFQLR
jgi:hypothetical protein